MIEVQVRRSSRVRIEVPGIEVTDANTGAPQDPARANLPVLFALTVAGSPDPPDTAYVVGAWVPDAPSPMATIVLGVGSTLPIPADGSAFDLWMGVNGTAVAPRDIVGRVVVP